MKKILLEYYIIAWWTYYDCIAVVKKYRHKRKIKRILRKNKDIAKLSKLAGINEQN